MPRQPKQTKQDFPVKGLTEVTPYSGLPSGFTMDALNVRPFDAAEGRLRGGQRPGTSRYIAGRVNGALDVQFLGQGTVPTLPTTGGSPVFSEDFSTYTAGQLDVVEPSKWVGYQDGGSFATVDDGTNHLEVTAAKTVSENSGGSGLSTAMSAAYMETYTLPSEYDIVSTAVLTGASGIGWNGSTVWNYFRMDRTDLGLSGGVGTGMFVSVNWDDAGTSGFDVTLFDRTDGQLAQTTGVTIPLADANTTAEFTILTEVRASSITVKINGTAVITYTGASVTNYSAEDDFAIAVDDKGESSGSADNGLTSFIVNSTGTGTTSRNTYLVAVAGGAIVRSDSPPTEFTVSTGGGGDLSDTSMPVSGIQGAPSPSDSSPADIQPHMYFCDGVGYRRLNLVTNTASAWTPAAGSLPVDGSGNVASIAALYRNRVVLAGVVEDAQNWYMSAVGDPLDWDYSPAVTTATQAVAGNNTDAGRVADVIRALIPYGDDTLIFGGDRTIWRMAGDPAAGGVIDNVSYDIGVVGQQAFARAPDGSIYFFGTNGLNRLNPRGGAPELVSQGKLDRTFTSIDLTQTRVVMAWDRDRYGCHIFFSAFSEPGTAPTHFWYDQRTDSIWQTQYPVESGPSVATVFDGDRPGDRALVFAGWDGFVRIEDDAAVTDNTGVGTDTSISSRVSVGPLVLNGIDRDSIITAIKPVLGSESADVTLNIYEGNDAEDAADSSTVRYSRSLAGGVNRWIKARVRGHSHRIEITHPTGDSTWSMETMLVRDLPTGLRREGGV